MEAGHYTVLVFDKYDKIIEEIKYTDRYYSGTFMMDEVKDIRRTYPLEDGFTIYCE